MDAYTTFTITAKNGKEVEMAVMDEFEYNHKHYVASAVVEGDTIRDDGRFIYRCKVIGEEIKFEPILNAKEYTDVTQAYLEMEE